MDKFVEYDTTVDWKNVFDGNNIEWNTKMISLDNFNIKSIDKNEIDDPNNEIYFSVDNEKILNKLDDIMLINNNEQFVKLSDLEIIKHQEIVASYLTKYVIQNSTLNYIFFTKMLQWISTAASYLGGKIKMAPYKHDAQSLQTKGIMWIPRCSYKFCSYRDKCSYNYDETKEGCYADHYVHNMVAADIDILIKYLEINFKKLCDDKNSFAHNKEIIKCVNTVSFVIKHMHDELNNICQHISTDKQHLYHVNRKAKK
ncbi:MAG: hypothetical protein Faunusvirus46_3 [Faunusvirus sp.]|jgi:hypothetical protein|uniref:Uncharacterized protein n=1 Tax=Faunusvirus sp. TaxID=2487766 RepID=A0A3G4ZXW1_9VIRU|nr:MAG: hypothetical protein Faunusvirus46_3 [Faunusvirus sp.]